ncbi:MAG: hypothetical protein H7328_11940 [Bdellovibrio sp.]|nr:hypothetical protein [Bdellovibrio sp.]
MKFYKNYQILALFIALSASSYSYAGTNPSIAQLKIYGVGVANNADCSNATIVGLNSTGTTFDMLMNPTIVRGSVAAGTYNCIILIMDATVTFTPATGATGSCTAGTSYGRVLCQTGCSYTAYTVDANNLAVYGGSTPSTAASSADLANAPKVMLFLSTSSVGNGMNAFLKPGTGVWSNGLPLLAPLTVSATGSTGTFVTNFDGQVNGNGGTCDLIQPSFTFR